MSQGPYLPHDPISLTLCADLSRHIINSPLDAVWQLEIPTSDNITLKTSFGLHAQSFKLFPIFMINKVGRRKTEEFLAAPQIRKLWSDHIQLSLNPCPDCLAVYDLWAASPELLESRILLKNIGTESHELGARVAAQLSSFDPKNGMTFTKRKNQSYIKGESEGLQISLIMDGQVKPVISPELALENSKFLKPNESLSIFWRCKVSKGNKPEEERLFSIFPVNWDAEIARLELRQQTQEISITTPNVAWDIAFRMVQHQAQQLLLRASDDISLYPRQNRNIHSQFLIPDQSAKRNNQAQNGVSSLALWQLILAILPSRVDDAAQLFETYLQDLSKPDAQSPNTELSFPILCQLGWRLYNLLQDNDFLKRVYPLLRAQVFAWFWRQNDRDQDGIPEWFSYNQTCLTGHPNFDLFQSEQLITALSNVESLGLAALLLKECQTLQIIARFMEDDQTNRVLTTLLTKLQLRSDEMRRTNLFYRDRESHQAHPSEVYYEGTYQNLPKTPIELKTASRLNFKIKPDLQIRKPSGLKIHGLDQNGMVLNEEIQSADIQWLPGLYYYSSKALFSRFDGISGAMDENTHLIVYRADITPADISQLLAWNPNKDMPALQTVFETYLAPENQQLNYGLPDFLPVPKPEDLDAETNLAWNGLVIQHLLSLDEREIAFRLFNKLMQGNIKVLKQAHASFERISSASGQALGKANDIHGLVPLSLFLDIIGVKIYSPTKVTLSGHNPVPWPVTVRYMGLEITRDQKNSKITLPDGSTHNHFGSATKTFTMEKLEI